MTVQALRPYADVSGIFMKLEYRASPTSAFCDLPLNGDSVTHLVRMDDLRLIPRHEFKVALDASRLKPHYNKHQPDLRLIVLTRDSMLRREVVLGTFALDNVPAVLTLRPEDLRTTGHRDQLPLEFVVVALPVISGNRSLPTQKASRLAELHVTIINTTGGATFPYKRVTVEELEEKDLPSETGVHLELICGVEELIRASDTPPHALFEVWIHEKVWGALQNDRSSALSHLRMLLVTETATALLLSAVIPSLKAGNEIEDGSVVGQLLAFAEKQSGKRPGSLRIQFQESLSLSSLAPYLQAAFRFATIASKVDDDEVSQ
jgi:hypothetical protein